MNARTPTTIICQSTELFRPAIGSIFASSCYNSYRGIYECGRLLMKIFRNARSRDVTQRSEEKKSAGMMTLIHNNVHLHTTRHVHSSRSYLNLLQSN